MIRRRSNRRRHKRQKMNRNAIILGICFLIVASVVIGVKFISKHNKGNVQITTKPNKEISKSLFLSEGTVKNYVSNIYIKTNVRNRIQLIKLFS